MMDHSKVPQHLGVSDDVHVIPAGFFVLRTPLLAFSTLENGAGEDHETWLRRIIAEPIVREAIGVASPDLYSRLDAWQDGRLTAADYERVTLAVARYVYRMAGRSTPFGLFAGLSIGTFAARSELILARHDALRRCVQLDMATIRAVVSAFSRRLQLQKRLKYLPNDTIYDTSDGSLRYVRSDESDRGQAYTLVGLVKTPYLDAVLRRASSSATIDELAGEIARDGITPADAVAYVENLIDNQALLCELTPSSVDEGHVDGMAKRLREAGAADEASYLDCVAERLAELGAPAAVVSPARYAWAMSPIALGLGEANEAPIGLTARDVLRHVRVDLFRLPKALTLSDAVAVEISNAVRLLHQIGAGAENNAMARFKESFLARYGAQAVPLMVALDEDLGIGFDPAARNMAFSSPELERLDFPSPISTAATWSARDQLLLTHLTQALGEGFTELDLESKDVERIAKETQRLPLPDSLAAKLTISAASTDAVARGDYSLIVDHVSGPSAGRPFGRFCYDPQLRSHVEELLRQEEEEHPDAIFAEVAYLPSGHAANVAVRPILRRHYIPLLGAPQAGESIAIPLDTLWLQADGSRLTLWSAKYQRQIVPRITNMHAAFSPLNATVYRFLHALQFDGLACDLTWSWGALATAPFLPRVRHKRIVCARARWRLNTSDLRKLQSVSLIAGIELVQGLRNLRKIPRWVALAQSDNFLPIDLESRLGLRVFLQQVRGRQEAVLVELYPTPDLLCVEGPNGRYAHEMVVPIRTTRPTVSRPVPRFRQIAEGAVERQFPPGSSWLSTKIYSGPATSERILRHVLPSVVSELERSGAIDAWFFIRYSDPDFHIRLRLRGDGQRLVEEVLPRVRESFVPFARFSGLCRIEIDTYRREVERYGGADAIALAEDIFHADSVAVLDLLQIEQPPGVLDGRLQIAFLSCDALLNDFNYSVQAKAACLAHLRNAYGAEFKVDRDITARLATRFREWQTWLRHNVRASREDRRFDADTTLFAAFKLRSEKVVPLIKRLAQLEREDRLCTSLGGIHQSFLHMHLSRLMRSSLREHELIVYDFLDRHYRGIVAQISRASGANGERSQRLHTRPPDGAENI